MAAQSFFEFDRLYRDFKERSTPPLPIPDSAADDSPIVHPPWPQQLEESASARRKYRIWEEAHGMCVYCGKSITPDDFINGVDSDIEHIIPQAMGGRSVLPNLICSCRKCNRMKGDLAPMDFMLAQSPQMLQDYLKRLRFLAAAGDISKEKYLSLLMTKQVL